MSSGQVAHFSLVEKLGEGGMGQVWIADDLHLKRRVALKLLRGADTSSPEVRKRFAREARAAAGLSHPNICTIYEAGESEDGTPFISMELMRGTTLRERIESSRIHAAEAASVGAAIADALHAAHAAGVLHRDIKPGNVMLTEDGRLKVLDFGLARVANDSGPGDETALLTTPGTVMGTPSYMSPEQALGRRVDAKSDIFSLGVVLYEMVTGARPFDGATAADTLHRIIEAKPVSVRSIDRTVSPRLADIIERCLARDPEQRWSAGALAGALRATPAAAPNAAQGNRVRHGLYAGGVVALAAAAALWFVMSRPQPAAVDVAAASAVALPAESPAPVTLAVLPLTTIGTSDDSEYFADGVTEEIINTLAEVRGLHIVSRTSAFAFKGTNTDIRDIGQRLNVTKVVEGSVRRAGDRVRIAVRLTNVADGVQLWTGAYERDLKDVFALQDEIAHSVADALSVRLAVGTAQARAVDPAVYLDYLKGRHFLNEFTDTGRERAVEILEDVTRRAPTFAPAYASLADAYLWLEHLGTSRSDAMYDAGIAAARKSIELDPGLGDGYAALTHALAHEGKMRAALAASDRAVELSPSSATAAQWHLLPLELLRPAELRDEALRCVALDPLSVQVQGFAGRMLMLNGAYADAIRCLETASDLAPTNAWNLQILAFAYALDGQKEPALKAAARAEEGAAPAGLPSAKALRGAVLALFGDPSARDLLASIPTDVVNGMVLTQQARGWAALGDMDRTVAVLERMYKMSPRFAAVNIRFPTHPAFDRIRADARYQALCARLGVPEIARGR